jgi:hypothetical protein
MFRLLNTYASSATQAKGQIWSEVRRQALFTIVLVVAVAAGSRWGISGAAVGVLVATMFMTVLLQSLVRQVSGLAWRDMLAPQVPGTICSVGLVALLVMTRSVTRAAFGDTPAFVLLIVCAAAAVIYYLGFLLFAPFDNMRGIVHESAQDLSPSLAKRISWLAPKELSALSGR